MLSCNTFDGYGSGDYVIYPSGRVREVPNSKDTPQKAVGYVHRFKELTNSSRN